MITWEDILKRSDEKLKDAIAANDKKMIERHRERNAVFQNERWYEDRDEMVVKHFLFSLGYKYDEAMAYYEYHTRPSATQGYLGFKKDDGTEVLIPAQIRPFEEHYFRFSDGLICKNKPGTNYYYYLRDGAWCYDGGIEGMLIDGPSTHRIFCRCDMDRYLQENVHRFSTWTLQNMLEQLDQEGTLAFHENRDGMDAATVGKLRQLILQELTEARGHQNSAKNQNHKEENKGRNRFMSFLRKKREQIMKDK